MTSATYKLAFNGNTLTYPSWNGYCSYVPEKTRYEYNLFGDTTSVGVSTGTVPSAFSAFDAIGIRSSWQDRHENFGNGMFVWFDKRILTGTSPIIHVPTLISDTSNYYICQTRVQLFNNTKTFSALNDVSTAYRRITTTVTSNTTFIAGAAYGRLNCIGQIIGVKYQ